MITTSWKKLGFFVIILMVCCLQESVSALSQQPFQQHPKPNAQQRLEESRRVGNNPLLSLNLNLDALARAQAPERAQELYERISALYKEGYYAVAPDVVSFNSVLKAWQSNPVKALEFWEQELTIDDDDEDEDEDLEILNNGESASDKKASSSSRPRPLFEPTVRSYNTFLLSLARAGLYEQSETLLRQMQDEHSLIVPDRVSYNTVLLAYCFRKEQSAAIRASTLIKEMIRPDSYVRPDIISFNTVIQAWANLGTKSAAYEAQNWFKEMKNHKHIRPDVYTYTSIIGAWARCGECDRALKLLRQMQHKQKEVPQLQPNKVTYTALMQALCRGRKPEEARALLNEMIEMSDENPSMRPDVVAFSALIDEYGKLADQNPKETIQIVMKLYNQMKVMSKENPDVTPNERTYTSVLDALARSRQWESGPLAEGIIHEMEKEMNIVPSVIHWNAVLNAYAKSPRANKVFYARTIWENMISSGVRPDIITYNSLLSVAANSFGKEDTIRQSCLQLGFDVFRTLQQDPDYRATSLTFQYLLKIIRKFMAPSEKRWEAVQRIFDLCCQQGCLNDHVLEHIVDHVGLNEDQLNTLFGEDKWQEASVSKLPPEWSQHSLKSSFKMRPDTLNTK